MTGVICILVALFSVAIVPVGILGDSETPLVKVVETAAPGIPIEKLLPFIWMFAVANSALINMSAGPRGSCCSASSPSSTSACSSFARTPVDSDHVVAPTVVPIIAGLCCAFLVLPITGRDTEQYVVAGWLLVAGVVLWAITRFANRALRAKKTYLRDPEELSDREGGVN